MQIGLAMAFETIGLVLKGKTNPCKSLSRTTPLSASLALAFNERFETAQGPQISV
jgi:hypothetical protein